ncbi:MFS transporter [Luteipulveratus sp. YIM 133132]|uniref:MFS transporter n=1 Tax=Luteipulveratus flavus TaxID=3031728 RepID=UPI0023B140F0|nr:MFS transporter [Luteipulveratus sp. YIM 133132]MDE9367585.1 MFS transporter [Luteipulveratus sp. YIM 133132]
MTESAALHDICDDTAVRPGSETTSHVRLALLALALGGFGIGTTEFVTMGLLPQIADGVSIDIPTAGHVVSAYALGVVVGAPALAALTARLPRKPVLVWLMVLFAVGNFASALAPSYGTLLVGRFVAGLPHGAFFGLGSVVAASLVPAHRRTWAVAMMLAGLTVANILGVPVATLLGQHLGWQWPYALVALIAVLTVLAVLAWVPSQPADAGAGVAAELRSLRRPQVWLALAIGTVGFGGMFATFSYITPTMTELAGFGERTVPAILVVYGVGMTTGAFLAGRVAQRGIMRGIVLSLLAIAVLLAAFGFLAQTKVTAVPAVFLLGLVPTILVPMLQTRLMDVAHEGQSLAAALNHSTLNIANALGAWLGGVVLAAGYGYEWPSRLGAGLAVLGVLVAGFSAWLGRRAPE